jgi:glycosyltransferase involved in cell wall biosynthesis
MKLSVISPCSNAAETIGETLDAFVQQRWEEPWEIIVANNRSTDNSMPIVERYYDRLPNLRVIEAVERQGQPYALNTGAKAALGRSIAFCDADDVVGEGWVAAMGHVLEQHEFVAARVDVERLNAGWILRSRGNNQRDGLQPYRYPPYLPHAGGGTIGVRRAIFNALGGFDEALPYLHDTDFCWKAQLCGFPLHFAPEAVMHIRYRAALTSLFRQARNYAEYNVALYKRYRPRGMPPITMRTSLKAWVTLLRRLPYIRDKAALSLWVWGFAQRLGRLQGSIKYRVMAL